MTNRATTIAIVGGGAAGLTSAIAAAHAVRQGGANARVRIYEKDDRIGRSILATGNGRCNFSNAHISVDRYHNASFVQQVYAAPCLGASSLAPFEEDESDAVHVFFRRLGLVWREEADGRQFPLANKASVVLDVLRAAVDELGVEVACNQQIAAIEPPGSRSSQFTLRMEDGALEHVDSVIITCGGHNATPLRIEGIPARVCRPVLGPLSVAAQDKWFTRELDNIRVRAGVSLWRTSEGAGAGASNPQMICSESGELMFRKYGLSGICIFDLSRFAEAGDMVRIDFLASIDEDPAEFLLQRFREISTNKYRCMNGASGFQGAHAAQDAQVTLGSLTYEEMLRGLVLPRVAEALLKRDSINLDDPFSEGDVEALVRMLTCCDLRVDGIADPTICQVQRGGFDVAAFDPNTLQLMNTPDLFAAGEALDVDGPCGGYNLHWAWASGLVAGNAAARLACASRLGDQPC